MANTLKFGNGQWATKVGSTLAYNDEGGNFKPLPFNFTRSTGGTRVNKDGLIEMVTNNKPRIDFLNDSNGALLLEPNRSNIITYSEDFSKWSPQDITIVPNVVNSPYGINNATEIIEGVGTTQHRIVRSITFLNSTEYTASVYVKRNVGLRNFAIISVLTGQRVYYDLTNGTVLSTTLGSGTIESVGNGWFKCTVTGTSTSTSGAFYLAMADVTETYTGDGTSSLYIWGCQNEQGSYATSYIPTQGATATRAAEVCTGAGNDQVINSTEGVLYAEIAALVTSGENRVITISDGSSNNSSRIQLYTNTNEIEMRTVVGGVVQALERVAISNTLNFNKIAYKYKANDFQLYVNGSKLRFDTSGSVSAAGTYNAINFDDGSGSAIFYGKARDIRVYNEALTDAELISLTTL
jgi:hypothetical protein